MKRLVQRLVGISFLAGAFISFTPQAARASDSILFGNPKNTVYGSTGFTNVLRGGYVTEIGDNVSIGAELALDLGWFGNIDAAGEFTFAGMFAVDVSLLDGPEIEMALHFRPGIGVYPRSFRALAAIPLHAAWNIGYKATDQISVGGGLAIPLTIYAGDFGFAEIPILVGPMADFELTPELDLFTSLQFGPAITAGTGSTASFGFDMRVGVAYSF